jgi:hypothetical protein
MGLSAEETENKRRSGAVNRRLSQATIILGAVTAIVFLLSYIPKLSELAWLKALVEMAGACDAVLFFALMYLQLASDRAEIIAPMGDDIRKVRGLVQPLGPEMADIREELAGVHQQMVKVSNTRWLADSNAFMGRLGVEMNSAIDSEPHRPRPILRLMRLSGHWKLTERLEHAAELLAKFFDTGHAAGKWASRWEVQMLDAVSDNDTFTALLNERVILGRVFSARPTNYKFRLIPRKQFEPSIGLALIDHDIAFVSFDESRADPFPEGGLVIHGDAIGWYRKWFDEMFESSCAVKVYERGRIEQAGIDQVRKELAAAPGRR